MNQPGSAAGSGAVDYLRYVSCVSWPRSGHHLLVNVMTAYFGQGFHYCEYYSPSDCCKTQPCSRASIHLSKNHDFGLATEISCDVPYIVQFRSFAPSVISNFELAVRNGTPDTKKNFQRFAIKQAKNYLGFIQKWVLDPRHPREIMLLSYERLTERPRYSLAEVAAFMAPGHEVEQPRLFHVIESVNRRIIEQKKVSVQNRVGIGKIRDVRTFRHYDDEFNALLDRMTAQNLPQHYLDG